MALRNWLTLLAAKTDIRVKGDEVFVRTCAFCGNNRWNLQINVNKLVWHCWACDRGKGETLTALLHYYNIKFESHKMRKNLVTDEKVVQHEASLIQKELEVKANPLLGSESLAARAIKNYLIKKRGITDFTDIWYHPNFVVIPLYQNGKLVYYVERQLFGKLYRNPKVSKTTFLATMGESPIGVLCEGVFDALTVKQFGFTGIPLLGKFMSDIQYSILRKYNFSKVIVCLDEDASKQAVSLFAELQYRKFPAYLALLPEGEDANSYRDKLLPALDNAVNRLALSQRIWLTRSQQLANTVAKNIFVAQGGTPNGTV